MGDWIHHLERGQEALAAGEVQVAHTHFMAAHEKNPEDPVACYAYGRSLVRLERWDEAEPVLKRAYEQDDSLVDAACEWVRVKVILGADLELALKHLDELERRHPREYLVPLTKIEVFLRFGDELGCRSALESARNRGAAEPFLLKAQAKIEQLAGLKLAQRGEFQLAHKRFSLASELDPDWGAPCINQGTALLKLGDPPRAKEAFIRGLQIEPHNPVGLYNLAHLLYDEGEVGAAAHTVKRLLSRHPEYPGATSLADKILKTV